MDCYDKIFKTNYYPISLCDLNTKFNYKSSSDWSKSNLIALVSSDGIYILKPQLNNQEGPFQIELIRNPTVKFKHSVLNEVFHRPSFDINWAQLNRYQYMEAYLDPALNTNIEGLSLDLYPRHYKFLNWSPPIHTYPRQCLLATITLDYQLLVLRNKLSAWVQIDLSAEYDKIWAQLNTDLIKTTATTHEDSSNINFEAIKNDLHSLSFCNACWKMTNDGGNLLLLSATIPGDIVIWHCTTKDSAQTFQSLQFSIISILKTNLNHINSMQLINDLLIVASKDGQTVLYDLTSNFEQIDKSLKIDQQQTMESKTLNLIMLPPTATLWHSDNIEVSDFYVQKMAADTFRIVLAKSTNICWCFIKYTKQQGDEPAKLVISESVSAIDGKDPEVLLHQTPATWLKKAGEKRGVLIADDGSFFKFEFVDDKQDTIPEFHAIRTGKNDLTRLVPRGLCTSPNGHLITMTSYITLVYEPAKIASPTRLILLPTVNDKDYLNERLDRLLDENEIFKAKIKSPMDVCDLIDYFRSIFSLLSKDEFGQLYKRLRDVSLKIKYPKNDAQLVIMKITAFLIAKMFDKSRTNESGDNNNTRILAIDLDREFYDPITVYNIEKILKKYLSNRSDEPLTEDQCLSLMNYFEWLNSCPNRLWLKESYLENFEHLRKNSCKELIDLGETCPICNLKIPFVTGNYGNCVNGHKLDRCSRSMLIINLQSNYQELICEHCSRHYMTKLIWPTENLWLCPVCQ